MGRKKKSTKHAAVTQKADTTKSLGRDSVIKYDLKDPRRQIPSLPKKPPS